MKTQPKTCWFFLLHCILSSLVKVEWTITTIKCLFRLEYQWVKTTFNKVNFLLLTFISRKLEDQQELVTLLVQAVNYDFLLQTLFGVIAKAEKLTWSVRQKIYTQRTKLEKIFFRSCELIDNPPEPYLILYNMMFIILKIFPLLQMLHGCRTDLILKYLVYSKKDRNFHSYLPFNEYYMKISS